MSRHLGCATLGELTELLAETQAAIQEICASPLASPLRRQLDSWHDLRRLVRQELEHRASRPTELSMTGSPISDHQKGMACP